MLVWAAVLFGCAVLGGVWLLVLHLRGAASPMGLSLGHGLLAVTGLVMLLWVILPAGEGSVPATVTTFDIVGAFPEVRMLGFFTVLIFVVAALGGVGLFSFHIRKKPLPTKLVVFHGIAAVVGFMLLLVLIFVIEHYAGYIQDNIGLR